MSLPPFDDFDDEDEGDDVLPPDPENSAPRRIKAVTRFFIDPTELSDNALAEAIEWHIPGRWDGRWSVQTRQLMKFHRVDKLALNSHWAMTSQNWECPVCGRRKPQIAFVNNGILFAQIVEHHDHIDGYVEACIARIDSGVERQVRLEKSGAIAKIAQRFERTLICQQCNNVDGAVKARFSLPEYFSFSPYEMTEFVSVSKDGRLMIDFAHAKAIYDEVGFSVEARKNLIDSMVRAIESGVWHYSKEDAERRRRLWNQARWGVDASLELRHMGEHGEIPLRFKMIRRSIQQDHVSVSQTLYVRIPDDKAFAAVAQQERKWTTLPDDWTCPGCGRTKHGVVRWSNKGRWTGLIYKRTDIISVSGGFMQPYQYLLCQCCDVLRQDLQNKMNIEDIILHAADIRAIITDASSHRLHIFDVEAGLVVAAARQDQYERDSIRIAEAQEYYYLSSCIDEIEKKRGFSKDEAVQVWAEKENRSIAARGISIERFFAFHLHHRKNEIALRELWLKDSPQLK